MILHSSLVTRYSSRLGAHRHVVLIVIVFLTFRFLLPFVFRNGSYFVETAPDLGDYLRWGALADSRLYPFVQYWSEYPPLFAWSMIGLYRVSTLLPAWLDQRLWFAIVMQLAMALFDLGSLLLVYAIALRSGHKTRAIRAAALFAAAFVSAYAASGWYEPVPLFFLLLALYLILRDRFGLSAVTAGIGLLIKIVPILIVPIALQRLTQIRQRGGYLAAVVLTTTGLMLPFVIAGQDFVLAFVRATLNRPTWLSIWALFDGNYSYGSVIPIVDRFSPENVGAPAASQLPWPIIHLAFAAVFLLIYTRRIDWRDPIKCIAFGGLTINLFLLWSKGFSGQFTVYVIPFIVLLMPNLRGALYTGLLGVLWVAEWPIAFQPLDGQHWFIAWLIIVRTAILIVLCFEYAARLFPRGAYRLSQIATVTLISGWISTVPVGLISISTYTQTRLAIDPASPAIDLIREHNTLNSPIVFANSQTFRRLYPLARTVGDILLLPLAKHVPEDTRIQWLNDLASHSPFWFIADESDPGTLDENRTADAWASDHACKVDLQWAGSAKVSRFVAANGLPTQINITATFADEVELVGVFMSTQTIQPGGTLCLEFDWQAVKTPSSNYTVFVHLVNAQGQVVAQNDLQPQGSFAPTSQWKIGSNIDDKHGLILPDSLPAGKYTIRAGLYRSDDHSPVRVTRGEQLMPDAIGITLTDINVIP